MRAVTIDAATPAFIPDHPEPLPPPGWALLRPLRVGIASADLAVAQGRVPFRGIPGHEFVAAVESHPSLPQGTRVVGTPGVPCRTCPHCLAGLARLCPTRRVLGLRDLDGCLADRFCLPPDNLLEIPKPLSDDAAAFALPLAKAIHAAQVTRVPGKSFVTILGDGAMGLLAAQVFTRLNTSVRVLGTSHARMGLCDKWGIKHRHHAEVTRRQDQDLVIETTAAPEMLALAFQLLRPRGRCILMGGPTALPANPSQSNLSQADLIPGASLAPALANELELLGVSASVPAAALREAATTLTEGRVDVLPLISRRLKLPAATDAYRLAQSPECVRVLIEP